MAFATVNISVTAMEKASDVSLISVITSFVIEGMIRLMTCGRIIFKKICDSEYPKTLAASYWTNRHGFDSSAVNLREICCIID